MESSLTVMFRNAFSHRDLSRRRNRAIQLTNRIPKPFMIRIRLGVKRTLRQATHTTNNSGRFYSVVRSSAHPLSNEVGIDVTMSITLNIEVDVLNTLLKSITEDRQSSSQ